MSFRNTSGKCCTTISLLFAVLSLSVSGCSEAAEPEQVSQEKACEVSEFIPVKLPDGTDFETWEVPLRFSQTYHVAQQHPRASDDNPGTAGAPWRTISKAAEMLKPGERVIVHGGVYREWVNPARGGTGPDKMISYEAAPGERVIIKGSEVWKPKWEKMEYYSTPIEGAWKASIDPELFGRGHAFSLFNSIKRRAL